MLATAPNLALTLDVNPQRDSIWRELHARPYVHFTAPAHVLHFSLPRGVVESDPASTEGRAVGRKALGRLLELFGLQATYETEKHCILTKSIGGQGRLVIRWAHHSGFVRFTFFLYDLLEPFEPSGRALLDLLPSEWLGSLEPGLLVATHIAVAPRSAQLPSTEGFVPFFGGHTVNGSRVMGGRADAWSCFRIHEDGFARMAVAVGDMSPRDLGRTVERLLDIEDFYPMALAPLPLATEMKSKLGALEHQMGEETAALRNGDSQGKRRAVLDGLMILSEEVEALRARSAGPFGTAAAYHSLLEERFVELREEKIEHVLRLSSFLLRRVRPAVETYLGLTARLGGLSQRIERATELLRAGIDFHVEEQTQRLLHTADRRASLQLRLQTALENLSIVVIAYYVLGLLSYGLKAANSVGADVDVDYLLGLALPLVLLATWAMVYRIRKRLGVP